MAMLISMIVAIILQCSHILKHKAEHLIQFLFVKIWTYLKKAEKKENY